MWIHQLQVKRVICDKCSFDIMYVEDGILISLYITRKDGGRFFENVHENVLPADWWRGNKHVLNTVTRKTRIMKLQDTSSAFCLFPWSYTYM